MNDVSMPSLIGWKTEPVVIEYGWEDVVLYNLGVGARAEQLGFLYENAPGGLRVLPSYAVVPEKRVTRELESKLDHTRMLHGEQLVRQFRPIPASGKLTVTCEVKNIYDKGKAAVIHSGATALGEDGKPVFETLTVGFYRGGGGFGGDPGPKAEPLDPPAGVAPTWTVTETIPIHQNALYRLSGDHNPLHIDPEFAKRSGFDRPILHGLCTYGYATRMIVERACDGDVSRFREFKARFADVVFPGEALTVSGWKQGDRFVIQATTPRAVVLSNAFAVVD
jgi:acyl dehydratase